MNVCMLSSWIFVQKNMYHSNYVFILKSSSEATHWPLHVSGTHMYQMEDENVILRLKLDTTILQIR